MTACPFVHLPSPPGIEVRCPYCNEISPSAPGVTITLDGVDWKARAAAAEARATAAEAALDAAEAKYERLLTNAADNCASSNERATAALEALKFYADPISYTPTQVREPCTAVHGDNGRRARAAILQEQGS
jgi:hypothetical protein